MTRATGVAGNLGLLFLLSMPASAGLITNLTSTATPAGSTFQYLYSVGNDSTSSGNIFDISFTGLTGDLTNIVVPTGWTVITFPGFIDWSATDDAFDVQPGTLLDGFGFESLLGPTTGQYLAIAIDPNTGIAGDFSQGDVVVPGAVSTPEPSTVFLLLSCLSLHAISRMIRQYRRPSHR